jgi:uncharacterized protein (TIGR00369 family)
LSAQIAVERGVENVVTSRGGPPAAARDFRCGQIFSDGGSVALGRVSWFGTQGMVCPEIERGDTVSHKFIDQMMEQSQAGDLRSPVSETLGMHLVAFGRGEAVYEMDAREELGNPLGVIQGGIATALADAAMAAATTTILTDEEIQTSAITTIDIFARFIRPVNAKKVERLRAEAKVVRAGGRLVWAEADLLADGEIVGKFAATGIRVAFDPQSYIAERGGSG